MRSASQQEHRGRGRSSAPWRVELALGGALRASEGGLPGSESARALLDPDGGGAGDVQAGGEGARHACAHSFVRSGATSSAEGRMDAGERGGGGRTDRRRGPARRRSAHVAVS
eukprot:scaffold701_cov351-Prasinococcus_capsulatus_cf.AAC.4